MCCFHTLTSHWLKTHLRQQTCTAFRGKQQDRSHPCQSHGWMIYDSDACVPDPRQSICQSWHIFKSLGCRIRLQVMLSKRWPNHPRQSGNMCDRGDALALRHRDLYLKFYVSCGECITDAEEICGETHCMAYFAMCHLLYSYMPSYLNNWCPRLLYFQDSTSSRWWM